MYISIDLTTEEKEAAERYAIMHNLSLEEAFKAALFERIEDECAIAFASEAYEEYVKNGKQSRPIDELWKELEM